MHVKCICKELLFVSSADVLFRYRAPAGKTNARVMFARSLPRGTPTPRRNLCQGGLRPVGCSRVSLAGECAGWSMRPRPPLSVRMIWCWSLASPCAAGCVSGTVQPRELLRSTAAGRHSGVRERGCVCGRHFRGGEHLRAVGGRAHARAVRCILPGDAAHLCAYVEMQSRASAGTAMIGGADIANPKRAWEYMCRERMCFLVFVLILEQLLDNQWFIGTWYVCVCIRFVAM